jgi:glycosyltransferase involved in cell wall biosynthesis
MRVITVTWSYPEPTEPFVEEKIVGLTQRGVECIVVAPRLGATDSASEMRKTPGAHSRRAMARAALSAAQRDRRATRRALALPDRNDVARLLPLIDPRADIIHFEFAGIALAHLGVVGHLRAAKVVTCHGSDLRVSARRSPEMSAAFTRMFLAMDRIHCVSSELAEHCLELGAHPDQLHVAPVGTDLGTFTPAASAPRPDGLALRIVSVGRIGWSKGYEYALTAVRQLRDAGHRITYTIAGAADDADPAVTLAIHEFGLQDVVHRVGQLSRREVRDLLAGSDVFLSSALSEGSSVATMDAMAMGLPVVVTDVGGQSEIVADGLHGFVVPSRDPAALAAAVVKLLPSETRRAMGAAGSEKVRAEWDSARQLDRLAELYRDLAAGGSTSATDADPDVVSVVMVAYNAAATIDAQLRALSFQQVEGPWEVVVVDNDSTDDTRARALAWADRFRGLRVVNAPRRHNIAYARNVGVNAARGSRILMCDSDDVVAPGWLAALARELESHPLVVGALERSVLTPSRYDDGAGVETEFRFGDDDHRPRVVTGNVGFRREVFETVGGFDESLERGCDLDFGWRAMDAAIQPHFVADAVVHYQRSWRPAVIVRKGFSDGRMAPALSARHRAAGTPQPVNPAAHRYRRLVRRLPGAARSPADRARWLYDAAQAAGQVVGSRQNRGKFL